MKVLIFSAFVTALTLLLAGVSWALWGRDREDAGAGDLYDDEL